MRRAALEVAVDVVADGLAESPGRPPGRCTYSTAGLDGVLLGAAARAPRRPAGRAARGGCPSAAAFGDGAAEGRAEHGDLDEVVEVAGLQRSVLAVVGEAEELACIGEEILVGSQAAQGGEREKRGCRAPPLRAEGRELGEIGPLASPVAHAAGEAEEELPRDPGGRDGPSPLGAICGESDERGLPVTSSRLDPAAAWTLLDPVLRATDPGPLGRQRRGQGALPLT